MRVHELAKELNLESKELMARLGAMGIAVKSHTSGMTDEQEQTVRSKFREDAPQKSKDPAKRERAAKVPLEPPQKISEEMSEEI
ncbi:MAG: translation initiation factor IF-2 N-terminal domain-containing protein, partial [Pseudomonadota bacterium]